MAYFFQVIDRSFGFDSAVEEAQRAINAAHVEADSMENGIGLVKLMGRYSGELITFCWNELTQNGKNCVLEIILGWTFIGL